MSEIAQEAANDVLHKIDSNKDQQPDAGVPMTAEEIVWSLPLIKV
jgi:hypothetical protein